MWPFSKKKSLADQLKEESLEAIDLIAEKWLSYRQLVFKAEVPLSKQIELFMEPAMQGLVNARPIFAKMPYEMLVLIFMNGIVQSGTHSALEVQDALGIPRAT